MSTAARRLDRLQQPVWGRPAMIRGLVATVLFVAVSATWGFAQPEEKPADDGGPGLRGIWPEQAPDDLVYEEIHTLGEHWEPWAAELSDLITSLYEAEELSAAQQRKVIAALRVKLGTMQRAIADPKYRVIRERLITLHGRLERRVDLAEAILDTLETDPEAARSARLGPQRQAVLRAVGEAEAYLNRIENGRPWIDYLQLDDLARAMREGRRSPAVLSAVHARYESAGEIEDAEQREFMNRPPLQRLERAVAALVAAESAPPPDDETVRAELARLVAAIERWEGGSLSQDAAEVRAAFEELRDLLPDAGERLVETLREHYFNYNFKFVASEAFLNRLYSEQRVEQEPVSDQVMGANVYGTQVTYATAGIDLKPSDRGAVFDVVASGTIQSNTTAVARQATIYASGHHQFQVARELYYDGRYFSFTSPVRVAADANINPYAARTRHSGWPIIGPITRKIALREANRRRGQSEATARQRIASRAADEFARETAQNIAEANRDLREQWHRPLAETGLTPNARKVRSTDHYFLLSSRVMDFGQMGASTPSDAVPSGPGVTVRLHESVLNRALDSMDFAGRVMTEDEVREEFRRWLSDFFGREIELEEERDGRPNGEDDQFVFHPTDPMRVQIEDGLVYLIVRTGLRRKGEEDIPTQVLTVPLRLSLQGREILITRGNVRVAPLEAPESRAKQIVRAGVIRKRIQEAIEDRTRSRYIEVEREGQPSIYVNITRVVPLNGWLTVWGE